MVHFAPEDIAVYVAEIARVLSPGGRGFLHHSNLAPCKSGATRGKAIGPKSAACGVAVLARKNPHGRNVMTCERFTELLTASGLVVTASEPFLWPPEPEKRQRKGVVLISDCLSSFRRPRVGEEQPRPRQPVRASVVQGGGEAIGASGLPSSSSAPGPGAASRDAGGAESWARVHEQQTLLRAKRRKIAELQAEVEEKEKQIGELQAELDAPL